MKRYIINCNDPQLRLGDKVAICYIAQCLKKKKGYGVIHIIDNYYVLDAENKQWIARPDTFPIEKYFPDLCKDKLGNKTIHKHQASVPKGEYYPITPPNIWITAPSMFKDTGFVPKMSVKTSEEFVTVHCLTDAPYNKARNMKKEQVDKLVSMLRKDGIPVKDIPQKDDGVSVEHIIDEYLCKSMLHIGGDSGFSHVISALDKPIIAIYGDDAHDVLTYKPLKEQLKASSDWCSNPISNKLVAKFVMRDNEFDVDNVYMTVKAKYDELKNK